MVERVIAAWRHAASIGSRLRRRPESDRVEPHRAPLLRLIPVGGDGAGRAVTTAYPQDGEAEGHDGRRGSPKTRQWWQ